MCCFSVPAATVGFFARIFGKRPRVDVSGTKIFARVEGGIQHLVYSMSVTTPGDVAMVLPLPVALRSDDALSFVNLSKYDAFFEHLRNLFFLDVMPQAKGGFQLSRSRQPTLVVHSVGSFEASYVPSISDFDRLDARFRLPKEVWDQRPEYAKFGFAVFKLKKGTKAKVHPMALRFPTSEPTSIFFPTLHVHDGRLLESADFEHDLYFQLPSGEKPEHLLPGGSRNVGPSQRSEAVAGSAIDATKHEGLVALELPVWHWPLFTELPNGDTRVGMGSEKVDAAA
jgi:hypothetical protein